MLRKLASDVWAGHPVEIERVEEVVDEMVESMVRNPDALMWVARLREQDITTYGHGLQVAVYLVAFGRHLGFPRAAALAAGHDRTAPRHRQDPAAARAAREAGTPHRPRSSRW